MRIQSNIYFKAFKAKVYGPDEHSPKAFGVIEMDAENHIDAASIFVHSEAEADDLIKAACALKDMLHAAGHAATMTDPLAPLPERGRYDAASVAEVERCNAAPEGSNAPTQWRCAKVAGHKYLHETADGGAWGDNTFTPAPERTATVADRCQAGWGSATESQRCTRLAGHDDAHRDCTGREWTGASERTATPAEHADALAAEQLARDLQHGADAASQQPSYPVTIPGRQDGQA